MKNDDADTMAALHYPAGPLTRALWRKAREFDRVTRDSGAIIFSAGNPYSVAYYLLGLPKRLAKTKGETQMERINALEKAIEVIDKAISTTSPGLPAARDFLLAVRKYLEDEQKLAFAEAFDLAA